MNLEPTTAALPTGTPAKQDPPAADSGEPPSHHSLMALAMGALGIVYGDIGTSPLYALKECFTLPHGVEVNAPNVLGILSLVFWSLIITISIKYVGVVMRADNRGEGGIMALMALVLHRSQHSHMGRFFIVALGIFGAALLYGDGVITPAISVLSAVEGLKAESDSLEPLVLPITIFIIVLLFMMQRRGTASVAAIFGPYMVVWFIVLALLGVGGIMHNPSVLSAADPTHAVAFFISHGRHGFFVLGSVFLCVTGGEALYADMGHFGVSPIRAAWFFVAMPALLLNYFGQGAELLLDPAAVEHPFYFLAPQALRFPLIVLATGATVIASQAVISGAFSLTRQAIQLGYCPRMEIIHTSAEERGQVYVPAVNWVLAISVIALVLGFRDSSSLAGAYGIAVTTTMVITNILMWFVMVRIWKWPASLSTLVTLFFLIPDTAFFGANINKIAVGGWFPLAVGVAVFTLLATWKRGRDLLGRRLAKETLPVELFLDDVALNPPHRVRGTAIFMTGASSGTPPALLHNIKHNKVLHDRVLFLTIAMEDTPNVDNATRVQLQELGHGFWRVVARYGFMETPRVRDILAVCGTQGLELLMPHTTFFLGRETLIAGKKASMARWREALFAWMSRNATSPTAFFGIPPNRVVELGAQIEL